MSIILLEKSYKNLTTIWWGTLLKFPMATSRYFDSVIKVSFHDTEPDLIVRPHFWTGVGISPSFPLLPDLLGPRVDLGVMERALSMGKTDLFKNYFLHRNTSYYIIECKLFLLRIVTCCHYCLVRIIILYFTSFSDQRKLMIFLWSLSEGISP